jgi:hypothetical protein
MDRQSNVDQIRYHEASSLSEYLGSEFLHTDRQLFFRGLPKESYKLIPTLFRMKPDRLVNDWSFYEFEILTKFQKAAAPHLKFLPAHFLEWLSIAQHYGVPTRLLDWTMSPLAALYFALEKHVEEDISENAVVWVLDSKGEELVHDATYTSFRKWQEWFTESEFSNTCIYHPTHLAVRVNSQQGCFTIHRPPEHWNDFIAIEDSVRSGNPNDEDSPKNKLRKILIPAKLCSKLWVELNSTGINRYTLFPDLDGLGAKFRLDVKGNKRIYYQDWDKRYLAGKGNGSF